MFYSQIIRVNLLIDHSQKIVIENWPLNLSIESTASSRILLFAIFLGTLVYQSLDAVLEADFVEVVVVFAEEERDLGVVAEHHVVEAFFVLLPNRVLEHTH